jgi:tRNA modification GTPase
MINNNNDTICAISTANGEGAISIIRISGDNTINICNNIISKKIINNKSHSIHLATVKENSEIIDEVLISLFRNPKSFTGEDVIEISCHGSIYIKNRILQLLIENGARLANPGEFTLRAFMNGKIDLSQAESIADLISSESKMAHQIAINHMKGGFSNDLKILREQLVNFASLIELELDFAEEDVEFANRDKFNDLLEKIEKKLIQLIESFKLGNVIKNGISVAILGAPNVGKSTLLNTLVNEEKAIVSEIAGTTRDIIEDTININGIQFRFIDTAGLRETTDKIEKIGIKKALEIANKADIVIYLLDASNEIETQEKEITDIIRRKEKLIIVVNKIDKKNYIKDKMIKKGYICISANNKDSTKILKQEILNETNSNISTNETIITNIRHQSELTKTLTEILIIKDGINNDLSSDLLSINIKQALYHLGLITGEISTDDLLGNIFKNFCIGK